MGGHAPLQTSPVDDGAADAAAAVRAALDGAYSHPPPMVPIAASRARSRAEWDEAGGDVETGSLPQQVRDMPFVDRVPPHTWTWTCWHCLSMATGILASTHLSVG